MGGQAFASLSPPLATPRMPPEIYTQVLTTTQTLLRAHYKDVASPIEGPGKDSFGDIDILVFKALDDAFDPAKTNVSLVAEYLAVVLGARKWIRDHGNLIQFALPWPSPSPSPFSTGNETENEKYIQLDLHICHDQNQMQWTLFHAAHGDLWNILGSMIRRFGLTVNNKGMYLRIEEIEAYDRKKSMVLLTEDPGEILRFLGLEEERWWVPFAGREEMFEYAAGCRCFWVREEVVEEEKGDEGDAGVGLQVEGQEGGEEGKKKLKHNDRQRMAKRPIFAEWIDEFIPKCRAEGRFGNTTITREEIREDAFRTFGVRVREEYERTRAEWALTKHWDDLWRDAIKAGVPLEDVDPQCRSAAIRMLKSVLKDGEEFDGMFPQAGKKNEEGIYDVEEVKKFVAENWKRAGELGRERDKIKAIEKIKEKAAQKEAAAKETLKQEEDKTLSLKVECLR
jgi:hypothetical protein